MSKSKNGIKADLQALRVTLGAYAKQETLERLGPLPSVRYGRGLFERNRCGISSHGFTEGAARTKRCVRRSDELCAIFTRSFGCSSGFSDFAQNNVSREEAELT